MTFRVKLFAAAALAGLAGSNAAFAGPALSIYGGYQSATRSSVSVTDGTQFNTNWEGKPFSAPPYWGVRGTWWLDDFQEGNVGVAIDFSHTKAYADQRTLSNRKLGWSHFEFSDGLNLATANVFYRFHDPEHSWTPYLGIGVGADIPHVEVDRKSGHTSNYQLGGVSGQFTVGFDYRLTEHVSAFSEYKLNYSRVNVSIDSGASLKTSLVTHAIDLGLTYNF